ncbi:Protein of uncharacterised function (DUF551) [Yersinia massiliensis]|uniref:DUF551 domain-containing protein n=1 Tax=Yersinia massiliensis TaxID=419257 RepID=UPI0005E4A068|nr:DUF551 domain-containing protein [Yersinia massiliensis]CNI74619.1 Protein of uncharacterised function (DUF551) [Yersinia massiliensis]
MSKSIEQLITNLKAVAHEEIMFRESSDTSDKWQDEVTPENVLLLIAEIERIALAAKKADPVSFIYTGEGGYYGYAFVDANEAEIHIKDDQKLYLFPPFSQTNQSELSDSVNEFLKVLDGYKDQLVPINRNSALVNDLRKALSSVPQLNSQVPLGSWIKCSDQMPEDDTLCLGIDEDGVIWTMHFDGEFREDTGWSPDLNVTHWMPLPAAPEKENG